MALVKSRLSLRPKIIPVLTGSALRNKGVQKMLDAVVDYLAPVRERYHELRGDESGLEATLEAGAGRAREIAAVTLAEVRDAMGIGPGRG